MGERRVVCAALRADNGDLLIGLRHYSLDMHTQICARRDGEKFKQRHGKDQGFVDQHGVYMNRHEAYLAATAAKQLLLPNYCTDGSEGPELYSEGLY